jgi:hypothetical protein
MTETMTDDTADTAEEITTPAAETPSLIEEGRSYGLAGSYSPEDNKLRLRIENRMPRELYDRFQFKARGFSWAPKQKLLVAPKWTPARHDFLMQLCGEIGDEETSLAERAEQRADRFVGYQVNRIVDGDRAYATAQERAGGIPLGQPIMVGHHSQARAERDAKRIERSLGTAVIMWERADYWEGRAAGVIAHADFKHDTQLRARRIEGIETDKRRQERVKAQAEKELKAWTYPGMTAELARALAGRIHFTVQWDADRVRGWTAYDVLRPAEDRMRDCPVMTWQEVQEIARRKYPANIAYTERWIHHHELRITYERAILAAQGASHLLDKKPRPKQLPLLNYRAPEGLTVKSYGQTVTLPQVEMTSAEFQAIYSEKRGTRFVDGTHRVRFALLGGYWGKDRRDAVIFLTDSKEHERPKAPAPEEQEANA